MKGMRITENEIKRAIAELNRLEALINPKDTARYVNGELWSYDYYSGYGVYIKRGYNNPLYTNSRVTPIVSWTFLHGYMSAMQKIEHDMLRESESR